MSMTDAWKVLDLTTAWAMEVGLPEDEAKYYAQEYLNRHGLLKAGEDVGLDLYED
jgi:hypothetical protein